MFSKTHPSKRRANKYISESRCEQIMLNIIHCVQYDWLFVISYVQYDWLLVINYVQYN